MHRPSPHSPADPPPPPSRLRGWELLGLGAVTGMLAGLLEAVSLLIRHQFDGIPLDLGPYLLWMPAAANLLVFVALAVALAPVAPRWPTVLTPARVLGLFGLLVIVVVLQVVAGKLGAVAVGLVAVGGGVQLAQRTQARAAGMARSLARAAPGLAAALLLVALGLEGRNAVRERRALAALPGPAPGAPNVLLLILDTVRAANLSAYGYAVPTSPVLARLAAGGVRFGRAYSTAPWTLPSHASIMTGRWMHEQSASWYTPLDRRDSTLAEALAARGYRTGGMVANLGYAARWTGLDRGFAHYAAHPVSFSQVLRSAALTRWLSDRPALARRLPPAMGDFHRKPAAEVNDELLTWLDASGDRPFFAFLNYMDAHDPYLPQPPFDTAFAAFPYAPLPQPPAAQRRANRPHAMPPYDQGIASIDHAIGALLAALDRRGLLAHTLVIVTSDHGEEFGEHGIYGHGHTLYRQALAVPLIVAWPGRVPAGQVVAAPVSLRDLPATVLDLVAPAGASPFPGASLARHWGPAANALPGDTLLVGTAWAPNRPRWDPTSRGDLQGLFVDELAFLRDADRPAALWDLTRDSAQQADLAKDPSRAPAVTALSAHLDRQVGPLRLAPRP